MRATSWELALKPDHLPILAILVAYAVGSLAWWRAARANDARLRAGGLEAVADALRGPVPEPARTLGIEDPDRVHTWPYLLRVELLATLALMSVLLVWSILVDAPLEQEADPFRTPNPSKAPWYFVGLQELLVYFDPWIAGVVLPTLMVLGLALVPYLDPNPEGEGFLCVAPRRFALATFGLGLTLWLGLIVIGAFFRGPGWGWFWPWEPWDPGHVEATASRTWAAVFGVEGRLASSLLGGASVLGWYGLGALAWRHLHRRAPSGLGPSRAALVVFLGMTMLAVPLKMALHLTLGVKYVWVTPWFNL